MIINREDSESRFVNEENKGRRLIVLVKDIKMENGAVTIATDETKSVTNRNRVRSLSGESTSSESGRLLIADEEIGEENKTRKKHSKSHKKQKKDKCKVIKPEQSELSIVQDNKQEVKDKEQEGKFMSHPTGREEENSLINAVATSQQPKTDDSLEVTAQSLSDSNNVHDDGEKRHKKKTKKKMPGLLPPMAPTTPVESAHRLAQDMPGYNWLEEKLTRMNDTKSENDNSKQIHREEKKIQEEKGDESEPKKKKAKRSVPPLKPIFPWTISGNLASAPNSTGSSKSAFEYDNSDNGNENKTKQSADKNVSQDVIMIPVSSPPGLKVKSNIQVTFPAVMKEKLSENRSKNVKEQISAGQNISYENQNRWTNPEDNWKYYSQLLASNFVNLPQNQQMFYSNFADSYNQSRPPRSNFDHSAMIENQLKNMTYNWQMMPDQKELVSEPFQPTNEPSKKEQDSEEELAKLRQNESNHHLKHVSVPDKLEKSTNPSKFEKFSQYITENNDFRNKPVSISTDVGGKPDITISVSNQSDMKEKNDVINKVTEEKEEMFTRLCDESEFRLEKTNFKVYENEFLIGKTKSVENVDSRNSELTNDKNSLMNKNEIGKEKYITEEKNTRQSFIESGTLKTSVSQYLNTNVVNSASKLNDERKDTEFVTLEQKINKNSLSLGENKWSDKQDAQIKITKQISGQEHHSRKYHEESLETEASPNSETIKKGGLENKHQLETKDRFKSFLQSKETILTGSLTTERQTLKEVTPQKCKEKCVITSVIRPISDLYNLNKNSQVENNGKESAMSSIVHPDFAQYNLPPGLIVQTISTPKENTKSVDNQGRKRSHSDSIKHATESKFVENADINKQMPGIKGIEILEKQTNENNTIGKQNFTTKLNGTHVHLNKDKDSKLPIDLSAKCKSPQISNTEPAISLQENSHHVSDSYNFGSNKYVNAQSQFSQQHKTELSKHLFNAQHQMPYQKAKYNPYAYWNTQQYLYEKSFCEQYNQMWQSFMHPQINSKISHRAEKNFSNPIHIGNDKQLPNFNTINNKKNSKIDSGAFKLMNSSWPNLAKSDKQTANQKSYMAESAFIKVPSPKTKHTKTDKNNRLLHQTNIEMSAKRNEKSLANGFGGTNYAHCNYPSNADLRLAKPKDQFAKSVNTPNSVWPYSPNHEMRKGFTSPTSVIKPRPIKKNQIPTFAYQRDWQEPYHYDYLSKIYYNYLSSIKRNTVANKHAPPPQPQQYSFEQYYNTWRNATADKEVSRMTYTPFYH